VRLDSSEAPQRDLLVRSHDPEEVQSAQQKTRLANKAAFRP
jgi:hypothetical protein